MTDTAPAHPGEDRYCPTCGRTTAQAYCPEDGVATVSWAGFNKAPAAYAVGDVVGGRYRIEAVLGRGGYGCVYAAVHTGTRQRVAVKMLDFDLREAGEVVLRRFYKEAQVTAGLQHPNTVRVFDVGQDEGGPFFIAMELIDGPTLAEVIRSAILAGRAMPERQAIDVCCAVLRSLQEAHEKNLVHRDLKPANIMFARVAGETVVKVLDFGIARTQDSSLTGSGIAPGTPVYMSPEQCVGMEVGPSADVYAVGILLYLSCTGRLPFHSKNALEMMRLHRHEPPPDPRDRTTQPLSEGLTRALMRALEKAPTDRFQTAAEMREALEAVRAALPDIQPGAFPEVSLARDPAAAPPAAKPRAPTAPGQGSEMTSALPGKGPQPSAGARPSDTDRGPSPSPSPRSAQPPRTASSPSQTIPAGSASPSSRRRPGLLAAGMLASLLLGLIGGWALKPAAGPARPSEPTAAGGGAACVCPKPADACPACNDAVAQAAVAARIAGQDGPFERRLSYAREAVRLAPANPDHARLLAELEKLADRLRALEAPPPSAPPDPARPAADPPSRAASPTAREPAPSRAPAAVPAVLE